MKQKKWWEVGWTKPMLDPPYSFHDDDHSEKKRLLSHKLVAVDSLSCQSERELMKSIIPEKNQSTIFDKLIQAAVDDFISEGEVITINCHQKCWSLGIKIMSTTICCNLRYKLVGSFPDRAVWVRALAGDIMLCFWARHFQVIWGVTQRWTSIPCKGE